MSSDVQSSQEQFYFFFGHNPGTPGAVFSNWYPVKFTDPDDDTKFVYSNTEQYMMAGKARLFNDNQTLKKILSSSDPRTQKSLGRQVKGYDDDIWLENCQRIVERGCFLKFSQNPELKAQLLATKGFTLVEASPYDNRWGIGLKSTDKRASSRKTWNGTNLLGEILTRVRNSLLV